MSRECHAHIFMNGVDYQKAKARYTQGIDEADIRSKLRSYADLGITYIRDGGDHYGACSKAKQLAADYGITYRIPVFALHRQGHYGGIVGRGFQSMQEYHRLVLTAKAQGADFIKVMFSGIVDFAGDGGLTEEPLEDAEIHEMIHIAHEEGFAVMAHVNGERAVYAAAKSGVDSVEHGYMLGQPALEAMRENHCIWVPTISTVHRLIGSGRFDERVIRRVDEVHTEHIRMAAKLGVPIAVGSDAGAFCVPHSVGAQAEKVRLQEVLADQVEDSAEYLESAGRMIEERFVFTK